MSYVNEYNSLGYTRSESETLAEYVGGEDKNEEEKPSRRHRSKAIVADTGAKSSRWGESPLPGDFNYCFIPGWILRNLSHFEHCGTIRDKSTGQLTPHPENGKTVGLSSAERTLFIHIMSFKFDKPNSQAQVTVDVIAQYMGVTPRQVQKLRSHLVAKGALVVTEVQGGASIYDFSPLINQCFCFEVAYVAEGQPGYGASGSKASERKQAARILLQERRSMP